MDDRAGQQGDGPVFGAVRRLVLIGATIVLAAWLVVIALLLGIRLLDW